MRLINLTPHKINILTEGSEITIPPSGQVARCTEIRRPLTPINCMGLDIPCIEMVYGNPTNLPEPQEGTIYITSTLVAQAACRDDVLSPGYAIRDDDGNIIGCEGLQNFRRPGA